MDDIDNHESHKNHDPLEYTHFYLPKSWDQKFDASCHWEEVSDSGEYYNTILFFKDNEYVEWSNLVHDYEDMKPKSNFETWGIQNVKVDDCLYRAEGGQNEESTQRKLYLFIGDKVWAYNEKLELLP